MIACQMQKSLNFKFSIQTQSLYINEKRKKKLVTI